MIFLMVSWFLASYMFSRHVASFIFLAGALNFFEDRAHQMFVVRCLFVFLSRWGLVSAVVAAAEIITGSLAHHKSLISSIHLLGVLRHHHKTALDLRSVLVGLPLVGVI